MGSIEVECLVLMQIPCMFMMFRSMLSIGYEMLNYIQLIYIYIYILGMVSNTFSLDFLYLYFRYYCTTNLGIIVPLLYHYFCIIVPLVQVLLYHYFRYYCTTISGIIVPRILV